MFKNAQEFSAIQNLPSNWVQKSNSKKEFSCDNLIGWAQIQKVVLNHRSYSSWAGVHPPEHFEPKQRSVAASATQRTASKVLASQYWRPIFRGRNFGSKLKFYYINRCLGVQK